MLRRLIVTVDSVVQGGLHLRRLSGIGHVALGLKEQRKRLKSDPKTREMKNLRSWSCYVCPECLAWGPALPSVAVAADVVVVSAVAVAVAGSGSWPRRPSGCSLTPLSCLGGGTWRTG
jgi:hypothetical protein